MSGVTPTISGQLFLHGSHSSDQSYRIVISDTESYQSGVLQPCKVFSRRETSVVITTKHNLVRKIATVYLNSIRMEEHICCSTLFKLERDAISFNIHFSKKDDGSFTLGIIPFSIATCFDSFDQEGMIYTPRAEENAKNPMSPHPIPVACSTDFCFSSFDEASMYYRE